MIHVMTRLVRPLRDEKPMAVFDVETNPDNHAEQIMTGFFDGQAYTEFGSVSDMLAAIHRGKYRSWAIYAHFGGRFDFVHLAAAADRLGWSWNGLLAGRGSRLIALDVYRGGRMRESSRVPRGAHVLHFVDSFALLPAKLADLAIALAPELPKLEIDFRKATRAELGIYLERDCRALYAIMTAARKLFRELGTDAKRTIAATSLNLFRRRFQVSDWPCYAWTRRLTTPALHGGRTEVFERKAPVLLGADVNSMYPTVMSESDPPMHSPRVVGYGREPRRYGVYRVKAEIKPCMIPPLPLHAERLYFPIGTFETVTWGPEIMAALEDGHGITVLEGIEFEPEPGAFQEYVKTLYGLRANGGAMALVAKLAMNSLYGKFGEKGEVFSIVKGDKPRPATKDYAGDVILNDSLGILARSGYRASSHMLHHISGWITSCARVKLYHLLNGVTRPAYCDTDSVYSQTRFPESPALGAFKRIDIVHDATFVAPKLYCYDLETGAGLVHVKAAKGAPGADPCKGLAGLISGICTLKQYATRGAMYHFRQPRNISGTVDRKRLDGYGPSYTTRAPVAGEDCPARPAA